MNHSPGRSSDSECERVGSASRPGPFQEKLVNANDPAFPLATVSDANREEYIVHQFHTGMSIRAYFAAMLLTEKELMLLRDSFSATYPNQTIVSLQQLRLANADALISELNKPTTP